MTLVSVASAADKSAMSPGEIREDVASLGVIVAKSSPTETARARARRTRTSAPGSDFASSTRPRYLEFNRASSASRS